MIENSLKNKKIERDELISLNSSHDCKVSEASTEIMLERFYNGKKIEFPF